MEYIHVLLLRLYVFAPPGAAGYIAMQSCSACVANNYACMAMTGVREARMAWCLSGFCRAFLFPGVVLGTRKCAGDVLPGISCAFLCPLGAAMML